MRAVRAAVLRAVGPLGRHAGERLPAAHTQVIQGRDLHSAGLQATTRLMCPDALLLLEAYYIGQMCHTEGSKSSMCCKLA